MSVDTLYNARGFSDCIIWLFRSMSYTDIALRIMYHRGFGSAGGAVRSLLGVDFSVFLNGRFYILTVRKNNGAQVSSQQLR
jgi:hypothetical protein